MKLKYYLRGLGVGIILSTLILSFVLGNKSNEAMSDTQIIKRAEELGMEMKRPSVNIDYDSIDESLNQSKKDEATQTDSDKEKSDSSATDKDTAPKDDLSSGDNKNDTSKEDKVDSGDQNAVIDPNAVGDKNSNNGNTMDGTDTKNESKDDSNDKSSNNTSENKKDDEKLPSDANSDRAEGKDQSNSSNDSKQPTAQQPVTKTVTIVPGMTAKEVSNLLEDQGVISSASSFNLYLIEHKLAEKIISNKYDIIVNSEFKTIAKIITGKK